MLLVGCCIGYNECTETDGCRVGEQGVRAALGALGAFDGVGMGRVCTKSDGGTVGVREGEVH